MELEFRDGKRQVPDHLGEMMRGLETWKMTLAEAIEEANRRMERRQLQSAYDEIVRDHFNRQIG